MEYLKYPALVAAMFIMAGSCSEEQKSDSPVHVMETFVLESYSGAEVSGSVECAGDWHLNNYVQWCSASPLSGNAGTATVNLTAISSNDDLKERVGTFSIVSDFGEDVYYVVQKGASGVVLLDEEVVLLADRQELKVPLEGNIPITEDMVVSTPDWIVPCGLSVSDSTILEDGVTASDYVTTEILFDVESNVGEERSGEIVLSILDQEYTVRVVQIMPVVVDSDRQFYRNSAIIRFTGVYCGFCPWMSEGVELAKERMPDRLVSINFHAQSYSNPDYGLVCEESRDMEDFYGVNSYPYANFNNIAQIQNAAAEVLSGVITDLATEAIEHYPSKTGIMAVSECSDDGDISINAVVATKESLDYSVVVWILEDGLEYPQNGASDDYVHNYVVRGSLSDNYISGDPLPEPSGGLSVMHINGKLPSSVSNRQNAYAVIATMYPGGPETQTVPFAQYGDYGYVIDNVVVCPLDGTVELRYE